MVESLAEKKCLPCRGGVPPMERGRAEEMLGELDRGWELNAEGHLQRTYSFRNFVQAMDFANRVTEVAEAENHHPDLHVSWGQCTVEIWTHKIGGLTDSDYYFAAKADRVYEDG